MLNLSFEWSFKRKAFILAGQYLSILPMWRICSLCYWRAYEALRLSLLGSISWFWLQEATISKPKVPEGNTTPSIDELFSEENIAKHYLRNVRCSIKGMNIAPVVLKRAHWNDILIKALDCGLSEVSVDYFRRFYVHHKSFLGLMPRF